VGAVERLLAGSGVAGYRLDADLDSSQLLGERVADPSQRLLARMLVQQSLLLLLVGRARSL